MNKNKLITITFLILTILILSIPTINISAAEALSSDKYAFEILLQGHKVKLPLSVQSLREMNFVTDKDLNEIELDKERSIAITFYHWPSYKSLHTRVTNNSQWKITADQAEITSVSFSTDPDSIPFILSGGIGIKSSLSEVKEVFGKPTNITYLDSGNVSLEYGYLWNAYYFDFDEFGRMISLDVYSSGAYQVDENTAIIRQNIDKTGYKNGRRISLGSDLFACHFYLDYKYMQVPVKVSEFINDGWVLAIKPVETIASNRLETGFIFEKDNQCIYTSLINLSNTNEVVENCYVSNICVNTSEKPSLKQGQHVHLELPQGILLGESSPSEVYKAYSGDYEIDYRKSTMSNRVYLSAKMPYKIWPKVNFTFTDNVLTQVEFNNIEVLPKQDVYYEEAPLDFIEGVEAALNKN